MTSAELRGLLTKAFARVPIDGPPEDYTSAALAVVADWLQGLSKEQFRRADTHDWQPSREMALIRAMYLHDLAAALASQASDQPQPAAEPAPGVPVDTEATP